MKLYRKSMVLPNSLTTSITPIHIRDQDSGAIHGGLRLSRPALDRVPGAGFLWNCD
jgi:hypothetical protein